MLVSTATFGGGASERVGVGVVGAVRVGGRAVHWIGRYLTDARGLLGAKGDETALFLTDDGEPFRRNRLGDLVNRYTQVLLGHADLSTTHIYTRVSIEKLREVHARTHPTGRPDPAPSLASFGQNIPFPPEHPVPKQTPSPEAVAPSFEKALEELEALVGRMEDGKLPLEESLAAYQRGAELIRFCETKLTDAQARIAILEGDKLQDYKPGAS